VTKKLIMKLLRRLLETMLWILVSAASSAYCCV